jgi:hypothetical protein
MGCRYEWADNSHLIMHIYLEAPWTWEEFDGITNGIFDNIRQTGKPCATAVDVSKIGRIPSGNPLVHLGNIDKLMPENVFASAVVGAPYIATTFMDILIRARPRARRIALFAKTMSEAHEKIMGLYDKLLAPADTEVS